MLGIPMGIRKLEDLEQRPSNDPFIKEWEKQFKHVQKPTPAAIASVISDTTEADFMFRMNFITLFGNLLVLRHRPALRSWNTTTMRKRIKMETETRRLGKLEHHEEFDPEEEQDGMNVYKGLDVYVAPINDKEPETKEEYYEKIILKFDIISDERSELVRTLRNAVKKFEDDQMMIDFCKQYGELFNDNEFNLYESSKDNDSEGEPDGDNENNNHDDDGAPTADANKKKESENQKKERKKEEIDKQTEESGSEGTEESGSEGTEENGSEATEGGSDGKEENMNGDEREVTAQMDVNNQNKELNKEKDANETEDNDKMNNNDMKNDSVQEKQDTDKDENAKVDNVKEKQGDDKDEIGEDEFWNTQFTDSQCEEMENQAKEEIKKKKTAKRKSTKEMTPPSFSLALSPDTNKVEERAAKRAKKPSRFIVSPYINKKTATKGNAVHDEMMICSYLFSMEGSEFDFIFETKEGNATIRDYMQTLAPTLKIESNVIDTYCLVLNHEQGVNNKGKKTKHFFHTGMIGTTVIIDNSKTPMSYEAKYKKVCDVLKNMFSMHLKEVQHPRAKDVLNKKPTILRPKWGTEENNTDCGVFLMMHMENYNGENARNWNMEFPTEEEGNRYDIIKMRMRFAAKMLSHEINIHREEMSKQALEFADRNKEKKAREALIRGAIRVKKEKQESERVQSAI
ncbi:ulp1 protease family, C-terminal catalytic domain-containing protein [Tanacetum coccineum]